MSILIKNEQQIEGIRKSCQLAIDTIYWIESFVKPGVSTEFLNQECENYIRKYGGIPAPLGYHGYPAATCVSLNEVICHGIPKPDIILKDGDIVKIDVSTIVNGYFGDTCATFPVGTISDEAAALIAVAKDCLDIGVCQVRPDAEFGMIGKAIAKYAGSRGYGVVHQFCGHGTGLSLHEEPQICHYDDGSTRKMKEGMIFTIEPMINQGVAEAVIDKDKWTARTADGKLSAQFEYTILVTDYGAEVLTK